MPLNRREMIKFTASASAAAALGLRPPVLFLRAVANLLWNQPTASASNAHARRRSRRGRDPKGIECHRDVGVIAQDGGGIHQPLLADLNDITWGGWVKALQVTWPGLWQSM